MNVANLQLQQSVHIARLEDAGVLCKIGSQYHYRGISVDDPDVLLSQYEKWLKTSDAYKESVRALAGIKQYSGP